MLWGALKNGRFWRKLFDDLTKIAAMQTINASWAYSASSDLDCCPGCGAWAFNSFARFLQWKALFVIHSEHFPGPWIDQMYPSASNASYGLVKLSLALSGIITDPSVHILPRVGATIDNWTGHEREIMAVPDSTTLT